MTKKSDEEEEVKEAIESYTGDTALGPDYFTLTFFQQFWNIVKDEG